MPCMSTITHIFFPAAVNKLLWILDNKGPSIKIIIISNNIIAHQWLDRPNLHGAQVMGRVLEREKYLQTRPNQKKCILHLLKHTWSIPSKCNTWSTHMNKLIWRRQAYRPSKIWKNHGLVHFEQYNGVAFNWGLDHSNYSLFLFPWSTTS